MTKLAKAEASNCDILMLNRESRSVNFLAGSQEKITCHSTYARLPKSSLSDRIPFHSIQKLYEQMCILKLVQQSKTHLNAVFEMKVILCTFDKTSDSEHGTVFKSKVFFHSFFDGTLEGASFTFYYTNIKLNYNFQMSSIHVAHISLLEDLILAVSMQH